MNNINHLKLSWSVSRGRDTEGYNICRLDDNNTGKRYKCMGGGYDMTGTVFGEWLADVYQAELTEWAQKVRQDAAVSLTEGGRYVKVPGFYGVTYDRDGDDEKPVNVSLDGACGLECMLKVAEAIGLEVEREYVKKGVNRGRTIGWYVSMKGA